MAWDSRRRHHRPGHPACEQCRRTATPPPATLVEIAEAADGRQLSCIVARHGRVDLLLVDELGYVRLDPRGAELLFRIITELDEKPPIGLATNLLFSEWGTVFPNHAHILDMKGTQTVFA